MNSLQKSLSTLRKTPDLETHINSALSRLTQTPAISLRSLADAACYGDWTTENAALVAVALTGRFYLPITSPLAFTPPTVQEVKAFINTPHFPFRFKVHIHAGYNEDALRDGGEEARVVLDLVKVDYYFAGEHFCCVDLVDRYREWREGYGDKYYSRLILEKNVKVRRNGYEFAKISPRFPLCFA